MELVDINKKNDKPIALALGYFDSVHNGHKLLLDECVKSGYVPSVFTFQNNPQSCIVGEGKQCYTFDERVQIFEKIGIKMVVSTFFDKAFMRLKGADFLNILVNNFNIKMVVFGSDFTCGINAEYKANDVKEFFDSYGIKVKIVDLLKENGTKIASRDIRKLIKNGEMQQVNKLLPYPYHVLGKVVKGRNVGGKVVGYPTANIPYPDSKIEIKAGVYRTKIFIGNKSYNALTNVGAHPTFDDYKFNIESFVIDYKGNLYDKKIKIEFYEYLRGIVKFNNASELKKQIDCDLKKVLEATND